MHETSDIILFESFELDLSERQLRKDGAPVELGNRYLDALALMVREAGSLVTKDRFMEEVWRGIPVTDEALTQCIRSLRRALKDDAGAPRFIQTVPKHGYRFIASIEDAAPMVSPVRSHIPGRMAGAATIAGAAAGAVGGLAYGLIATAGGASSVIALVALVAALGTLGGAGVGLGAAAALAWRGRADFITIVGAALGGAGVGALGGTLGRDSVGLITGAQLGPVTGLFEGLVLGAVAGWATLLAFKLPSRRPLVLLAALVLGALAGLVIHMAGGHLLGATLAMLQSEVGTALLEMDRIGQLTGEPGFGRIGALVTAVIEGATFVVAIAAAVIVMRRR